MKNRSRLLSLFTAGALALTLTAPALAMEDPFLPVAEDDVIITTLPEPLPADPDGELTQEDEYSIFLEQFAVWDPYFCLDQYFFCLSRCSFVQQHSADFRYVLQRSGL